MSGFIKIHRTILESSTFKQLNSSQRDVMFTCLLMVNWKENEWLWNGEMYKCKPGQMITSLQSIAKNCGKNVKVQSVRTALLKLEKMQFLTNKSTKSGRLITICKWDSYQQKDIESNKEGNKELTKNQQRANKELTTIEEGKEGKEGKEEIYSFDNFWNDYDKKKGKEEAVKAWKKLNNDEKIIIKNTVKQFKKHKPFKDYTHPLPATYLNKKRFNDEIESEVNENINKDPDLMENGGRYYIHPQTGQKLLYT